jgi:hypothetical protein
MSKINSELNPIDLIVVPFFWEGASAALRGEWTLALLAYGSGGALLYAIHWHGERVSAGLKRFGSSPWGILAITALLLAWVTAPRIAIMVRGYADGSTHQIEELTNRLASQRSTFETKYSTCTNGYRKLMEEITSENANAIGRIMEKKHPLLEARQKAGGGPDPMLYPLHHEFLSAVEHFQQTIGNPCP